MKYFDAHTHVQFVAYDSDRDGVIQRALDADVGMVNVGTQLETSRKAMELAHLYPDSMYATVGLHPIHTSKSFHDADELGGGEAARGFSSLGEKFDYPTYRMLALDRKVVAIGECGLDYFRVNGEEAKKKQKEAFLAQIELAVDVQKPLMIHCRSGAPERASSAFGPQLRREASETGRNAFGDLIEILKPNTHNLKPSIVHFFSGTKDDAKQLLEMGFSFTFGGVITFTRDYDEVIKMIPLDRILSETDAPYVAPVPYRGRRNEPAYVVEVVKKLGEIRGVDVNSIREAVFENVQRLFTVS